MIEDMSNSKFRGSFSPRDSSKVIMNTGLVLVTLSRLFAHPKKAKATTVALELQPQVSLSNREESNTVGGKNKMRFPPTFVGIIYPPFAS